jgi:hypothetical protein
LQSLSGVSAVAGAGNKKGAVNTRASRAARMVSPG